MGRILDALKKADNERSKFVSTNPNFGMVMDLPEKRTVMNFRLVGLLLVCGIVGFLVWISFERDPQAPDDIIIGNKDVIYSSGQSDESISSVKDAFHEESNFVKNLSENYARHIEPLEELKSEKELWTKPLVITPESKVAPIASFGLTESPVSAKTSTPDKSAMAAAEKTSVDKTDVSSYVIRPGDNLSKIAGYDFVYGDRNQWKRIFEANKDKLKSPDQIRVGQEIIIPLPNRLAERTVK